jgi:HK97 family phage prohead protease
MERRALSVPFALDSVSEEKRADGTAIGTFDGMASTFGNIDQVGDVIEPGAFKDSVADPRKIKLLWQHDAQQPIGVWDQIRETDAGLYVQGSLMLDVQKGREAHALLKAGAVDALSIGFNVAKGGAELDRNGKGRRLRKIDLWEISVVTFPANPKARIDRVKSLVRNGEVPTERELERVLRDCGFSRAQAKAVVAKGYAGLAPEHAETVALARKIDVLATLIAG